MAQNLALKFSTDVDERFKLKSLTEVGLNNNYDWSGVRTVSVYGIDTVAMSDYVRSGANRYGDVVELGTAKQDLTLARDRGFAFTIDKGNFTESMMITRAGEALQRQLDEVLIPEIDIYRLTTMITAANANSRVFNTGATSSANAYTNFLALQESLSNDRVPLVGRVTFMTAGYYSFLKQSGFVVASEIAMGDRKSGDLGKVDGNKIVVVPSSYMSSNTDCITMHPDAVVSPRKIDEYKTHDNPPGVSGNLVEGRSIYDCFVLNQKRFAIALHRTA